MLKSTKFKDGKPRSVYPKCRPYVRVLEYAGVKKAGLRKLKWATGSDQWTDGFGYVVEVKKMAMTVPDEVPKLTI